MMGDGGESLPFEEKYAKEHSSYRSEDSRNTLQDGEGLIPRTVDAVFTVMAKSSPTIEYTVRCSYVEIFLEKILDLLSPGGVSGVALRIADDTSAAATPDAVGVKIIGASESCCINKSDVFALLARGNAFRTANGIKMSTDSSRSHVVFIMKVEQKNVETGETKKSVMHMLDLAGCETTSITAPSSGGGPQNQQNVSVEAIMNNRSLAALTNFVRAQMKGKAEEVKEAAYRQSKLTRLLRPSFGGNCMTTIILTASSSSYNIGETINTLRFGQCCRRIWNTPLVNSQGSPEMYQKLLEESEERHKKQYSEWKEKEAELKALVTTLVARESHDDQLHSGPLGVRIEEALKDDTATAKEYPSVDEKKGSVAEGSECKTEQVEIQKLQEALEKATEARDIAENSVSELQSEVAVLRSKNEFFCSESNTAMQDLINAEYQIQVLSQRKSELEHDLRISQFREEELCVFLRQFKRFYERLLKHRGAHGNDRVEELIAQVPGVPNMREMIDIDKVLLEKGVIDLDDEQTYVSIAPPQQLENADKNLEVDLLQRELLKVTEQCIELQIALKEEKESATKAALLGKGWGSMSLKFMGSMSSMTDENDPGLVSKEDLLEEAAELHRQLDRKNHDLQAIVWKMNELHVINETFNDKMASREQRVMILEKKLVNLQKTNARIITTSQESERKLRTELENLRALVDGMTIPLWQFGESEVSGGMAQKNRITSGR